MVVCTAHCQGFTQKTCQSSVITCRFARDCMTRSSDLLQESMTQEGLIISGGKYGKAKQQNNQGSWCVFAVSPCLSSCFLHWLMRLAPFANSPWVLGIDMGSNVNWRRHQVASQNPLPTEPRRVVMRMHDPGAGAIGFLWFLSQGGNRACTQHAHSENDVLLVWPWMGWCLRHPAARHSRRVAASLMLCCTHTPWIKLH